jgi:hypothetical protein
MHDKRSSWLKQLCLFFLIKTNCFSKFFINYLIVAWLSFHSLDGLIDPFTELKILPVRCAVDSELKLILALPKFLRLKSFNFSHLRS